MLIKLKIKNLAIIDHMEIDFSNSFNIITGESGSGKTIIYKSISYLLGRRFNKQDIRKGHTTCSIEGVLLINNKRHTIKRSFTKMSAKNSINDKILKLSDYIEIIENSWESYRHHEQQLLMDVNNHIKYLDLFAKTEDMYDEYLAMYSSYQKIINEITMLQEDFEDFMRNKELYEFQFKELNHTDIQVDEDIGLQEKISLIKQNKSVHETLYKLANLNNSSSESMKAINDTIDVMNNFSDKFQNSKDIANRLNEFINEFEDIKFEASKLIHSFYYNQSEIDEMNSRLISINELKRKYGGTISSINEHRSKLKLLIDNSSDINSLIEKKILDKNRIKKKIEEHGSNLYNIRSSSASILADKIKNDLKEMGMCGVEFHIELGGFVLNKTGLENCAFYIKTNKGEELKTLGKIVSGGELSRIMMSIKLSINSQSKGKLFVLDEIDAGLSGREADSIGNIIENLSYNNQVICITHLSQIASKAHSHYKVFKDIVNNRTECIILLLDEKSKINELASMVSGQEITAESIDYAKGILRK